jgi:TRAP-type mannitol/chloroaromatic compound transport system permease small subunit
MAGLILWVSLPYAARSWAILERSKETAGIPAVFLLKTAIPLFAALLILQAAVQIVRAAAALGGRRET